MVAHMTTASTYERVTFRPEGGRARTVYLRHPAVTGNLLVGVEVDREGDGVSGRKFDERRHVISVELVVARVPMRMDNFYGELVEA
jgi:hypothetical protein